MPSKVSGCSFAFVILFVASLAKEDKSGCVSCGGAKNEDWNDDQHRSAFRPLADACKYSRLEKGEEPQVEDTPLVFSLSTSRYAAVAIATWRQQQHQQRRRQVRVRVSTTQRDRGVAGDPGEHREWVRDSFEEGAR